MKRPLFIFSIYLMVFMSVAALTGLATKRGNIETATVAQAEKAQMMGSD